MSLHEDWPVHTVWFGVEMDGEPLMECVIPVKISPDVSTASKQALIKTTVRQAASFFEAQLARDDAA